MFIDPILQQPSATRHHAELIRDGERERLAGQVSLWYLPLTSARASLGAAIIRLGRLIQGAATIPAATHSTT